MNKSLLRKLAAFATAGAWVGLALVQAGCAKKAEVAAVDIGPEANAYYHAHPEIFHFSTPAALPSGLVWNDGHDVPTFADAHAVRGGTIHFWTDDFPPTLRFYGPDASGSFRPFILDDEEITLIQRQPNTNQYFPGVAREWAFDPDGRTMYFRLDPDARYADGVPVRADDFVFSVFFFRSPYLSDPTTNNYYTKYVAQITKYDDLTISVSWSEAKPDLADRLGSLAAVPEHFYREYGPDFPQRYQWRLEPTTGPYTIRPEDIHKGTSIELTRVPHWWADDKPFFRHRYNPDRIHFEIIRDINKSFEAFRRGEVDVVDVTRPQNWYERVPNSDPLVQHGAIAKATFYNEVPRDLFGIDINCSDPLLANRDIREGIAYSLNIDLVNREYFRGDYTRMQTSSDGYAEVPFPGIHPRPFSIDQALASFAKAGFTKRGPDGILVDSQGRRLSFFLTDPYEAMRDALTILRQEAVKAGLELNLEVLDFNTAFKKLDSKHFQIAISKLGLGISKYPDYKQIYYSTYANKPTTDNFTDTVDPIMDKLIDAYDQARTMDEIRRLAYQIELRIRYDAAFIPTFEYPYYRTAYWKWVKFPATFDVREGSDTIGFNTLGYGLYWIDDSARAAVQAAANGGPPLPVEIKAYDQWKLP